MKESNHRIYYNDSRDLSQIRPDSIGLVVTSPPYPMIAMWDQLFCTLDPAVEKMLSANNGQAAWECMHGQLDIVWQGLDRVVQPGGFACINIGDATRKTGNAFQLYPNHARIIRTFCSLGWQTLPLVLWRKTTNAPNKFMGAGMLPAGAYVTLEHEYILIFRKTGKRSFVTDAEKKQRRESAFFWEERNCWFSDTWNLAGTKQAIDAARSRERSAAYPFELAYRLINMYSVKNDTVLDPFLGTGTTILAAMCSNRHSIGLEIDKHFEELIGQQIGLHSSRFNQVLTGRLQAHGEFINQYREKGKELQHVNVHYRFPVVTAQEKELLLDRIDSVEDKAGAWVVRYSTPEASVQLAALQENKPQAAAAQTCATTVHQKKTADQGLLDFGGD